MTRLNLSRYSKGAIIYMKNKLSSLFVFHLCLGQRQLYEELRGLKGFARAFFFAAENLHWKRRRKEERRRRGGELSRESRFRRDKSYLDPFHVEKTRSFSPNCLNKELKKRSGGNTIRRRRLASQKKGGYQMTPPQRLSFSARSLFNRRKNLIPG